MRKVISFLKLSIALAKYIILFPFGKIYCFKKNVWIFCERGNDAKDNAFYFFKWINCNHSEIYSVYLIDNGVVDEAKVQQIGKVCRYGSLRHWLLFIGSKVRLDTHLFFYVPNKYLAVFFMKHWKKRGLDVFLQHGITHNWQDCFLRKNNKSDLVICGALPEYDYLLNSFDLGKDVLKLTGFSRFDTLINRISYENLFILIIPTWRQWLSKLDDEAFRNSLFYKNYSELLNNENLMHWAKDNGYKIVFYLHPSFRKYGNTFNIFANDIVHIITQDTDIQDLLCSASLLVTDYSSILFDFAYLKKPSIYFQFDSSDFYSKQYKHGFFFIDRDGFGPVATTADEVASQISKNISMMPKYLERSLSFFEKVDGNNNLRIYNEICKKNEEHNF